jgi:hypothetical protein
MYIAFGGAADLLDVFYIFNHWRSLNHASLVRYVLPSFTAFRSEAASIGFITSLQRIIGFSSLTIRATIPFGQYIIH